MYFCNESFLTHCKIKMNEKTAFKDKTGLFVAFVLLISSFLFFLIVVPYHIYFKEQIQLFTFDSTYIFSYFSKPGGLACLAGDFLTQFFYLKGGGAVIISLLFVLKWLLIVGILNSFGLKQMAPLWALLPVIAEWVVISEILFSIAMSVSFALVLLAILFYTKIQNKTVSIGYGVLFVPVLYILTGSAMFLFPVAILIYDIHKGKRQYLYWLTILVFAAIIPYLLRSYYLITINQAYFYPYSGFKQKLSSFALVLILFFASIKVISKFRTTTLSFSLAAIFILITGIVSIYKTTNFQREKILGMATEAYFQNWDKVLKISEKSKLENSIATYYTNLALSKKSQLSDRMLEFYQPFTSGMFLPVNPESNWFIIFFSSDVFFHIGDMNMAQHSAMLSMIFSPYQRSSRLTQRLAEINIMTEDIPAAMKYVRMLEASLFHSKKAVKLKDMALANNSDNFPLLQKKRSETHTIDTLRHSHNHLLSLELLVKTNPENQEALDYLLSFHLMNKNIPEFFNIYNAYCKGRTNYVPKLYAEALLVYFAAFNIQPETIMEDSIDLKYIRSFNEYTQLFENSNGDLKLLQKRFPDTYWIFYHFATLKT